MTVHNPGAVNVHALQWVTTNPIDSRKSITTGRRSQTVAPLGDYEVGCWAIQNRFGLPDQVAVPSGRATLSIQSNQQLYVEAAYTTMTLDGEINRLVQQITPSVSLVTTPTPLTASASILPDNSLIALVEGVVDIPGEVYVEYQSLAGGDRFQTQAVSSNGTDYAVYVARLRAETAYRYRVSGEDRDGNTSEGPTGLLLTGSLPPALAAMSYNVITGQPSVDITLMDVNVEDAILGFGGMVGIDGDGHIVWYFDALDHAVGAIDQKYNGNILYTRSPTGAVKGFGVREITPLGVEVDNVFDTECYPGTSNGPWHHDIQVLSDDEVLFLPRDIQDSFNDPTRFQEGDTFKIWDQSPGPYAGVVDEVWNVFDFIDPTIDRTARSDLTIGDGAVMWGGCVPDETVQNWTHGNSGMVAPDGSYYLYSTRHLDQVVSIAPDFLSLNWRLGGPGGGFTFPDPSDKFYHQHAATPIPNADPNKVNVLLFDNGNGRPPEEGGEYSRALELELDQITMEARKVWEYRHSPDLFAACCSNAHRLHNGNTLLVFGSDFAASPDPIFTIMEADTNGNAVWAVEEDAPAGKAVQYRVYPRDSIIGEIRLPDP